MLAAIVGAPGTGKSTLAVQRAINEYAALGRRVAANFPIDFAPVAKRPSSLLSRAVVSVIPDRPRREHLDELGFGTETIREEKFGLLIIDEAGIWLNSRTWQSTKVSWVNADGESVVTTERERLLDWLTQSRKYRWDVLLVVQSVSMLDKQAREVLEAVVKCRRLDRLKLLGVQMPRVHIGVMKYGLEANAPRLETWWYRGAEAHRCMDSYRLFGMDNASYTTMPATFTKWRGHVSIWERAIQLAHWMSYYLGGPVPPGYTLNRFGRVVKAGQERSGARLPLRGGSRGPQLLPLVRAVRGAYGGRYGAEPHDGSFMPSRFLGPVPKAGAGAPLGAPA